MLAAARLLLIVLAALSIVYLCLWFFFRQRKRDRLAAQWQGAPGEDMEAFLRAALARGAPRLRVRLFVAVYVLPLSLIAALIYVTNFM